MSRGRPRRSRSDEDVGAPTTLFGAIAKPRKAFEILETSKAEDVQASSFCARTIMFLTDGQADFDSDDYAYVRDKASKLQVTSELKK